MNDLQIQNEPSMVTETSMVAVSSLCHPINNNQKKY